MEVWQKLTETDFSDPINLIPFLTVVALILFLVALFSDRPPE